MASTWRRIGGLVGILFGVWLLGAGDAEAGVFRVHTCNRPDYQLALGPTLQLEPGASGWLYEERDGQAIIQDDCPSGGPFQFWLQAGVSLKAGDFVGAVWTPAPNTRLIGVSMRWNGRATNSAAINEGTSEVAVTTDRETILRVRSPWTAPSNSGGANRLSSTLSDASRFEMTFTCLDACTGSEQYWLRGWVAFSSFDVPETMPHLAGGTHRKCRGRAHLERCGASWLQCCRRRRRSVSSHPRGRRLRGGDMANLDSGHLRRHRSRSGRPEYTAAQPCPLRIDRNARCRHRQVPQGQHACGAARGRRGEPDHGLRPGDATSLRTGDRAGLGPRAAGRGQRRRGERPGAFDRALGPTRKSDAAREPVRSHPRRPRAPADRDGAPIADAAIDVVSKTTAVNARELGKRVGPRTGSDGRGSSCCRGASPRVT